MTTGYVLGVDLGQSIDPTAVALIEYEHSPRAPATASRPAPFPARHPLHRTRRPHQGNRSQQPPLKGHINFAVDATGPGRPVVDYLTEELKPHLSSRSRSPRAKKSPAQPQTQRPETRPDRSYQPHPRATPAPHRREHARHRRPHRRTAHLQTITNERGTDTYAAASGRHDDLVLALSLALWLPRTGHSPTPACPPSSSTAARYPASSGWGNSAWPRLNPNIREKQDAT